MAWFKATLVCASLTCAPLTAHAQFRPSAADQIKLGQKAAAQVRAQETVLPLSDPRAALVKRLGDRLVSLIPESERKAKPFEYTFEVIESPEINAFALPGGPIFFYTGLLANLTTEDQVMGVLAHEIIHVRREHWASAYNDNQKRQLGITVVLILLRANKTAFDIASVSDALLFTLPYSRKHETDSDKFGYTNMVEAGFNPQGMVEVFQVLKEKGGGSKGAEWLSTHPDSDNRIKAIQKRIAAETKQFGAQKPLSSAVKALNTISTRRKPPLAF